MQRHSNSLPCSPLTGHWNLTRLGYSNPVPVTQTSWLPGYCPGSRMGPHGSHMGPYVHIVPYGPIWVPYGPIWDTWIFEFGYFDIWIYIYIYINKNICKHTSSLRLCRSSLRRFGGFWKMTQLFVEHVYCQCCWCSLMLGPPGCFSNSWQSDQMTMPARCADNPCKKMCCIALHDFPQTVFL